MAEHDKPLRLRGAAHLLRAGHRGRGGALARQPAAGRRCSTTSRAPPAASSCSSCPRTSASQARSSSRASSPCAKRQFDAGRAPLPEPAQGRAARRALPRERAAHPAAGPPPRSGARVPRRSELPTRPAATRRRRGPHRACRQRRYACATSPGQLSSYFPWTTMGRVRIDHLEQVPRHHPRRERARRPGRVRHRARAAVPSSCAATSRRTAMAGRTVWVADAFRGSPRSDDRRRQATDGRELPVPAEARASPTCGPISTWCATASTASTCSTTGCGSSRATSTGTLPTAPIEQVALLRIGGDLGAGRGRRARRALRQAGHRRRRGRRRLRRTTRCRQAVDEFRARRRRGRAPGARRLGRRLLAQAGRARTVPAGRRRARHAGRGAGSRPTGRHAPPGAPLLAPLRGRRATTCRWWSSSTTCAARPHRTLHSLSPLLPGRASTTSTTRSSSSRTARTPTSGWARSSCAASVPSSATSTWADEARPSPVFAAQPRDRRVAGGKASALMIDGAHVLTPGVLHTAWRA